MAAEIPAWFALAGAVITGASGLAGAALNARWTRDAERARLQQERELHGARERITCLEKAIASASRLRAEVVEALKWFDAPEVQRGPPREGLWSWTTESQYEVKGHESALKLRFNIGPVTKNWESLELCLSGAASFCADHKPPVGAEGQPTLDHVLSEAHDWRTWSRFELERFITDAGAAMTEPARHVPEKKLRFFWPRRQKPDPAGHVG